TTASPLGVRSFPTRLSSDLSASDPGSGYLTLSLKVNRARSVGEGQSICMIARCSACTQRRPHAVLHASEPSHSYGHGWLFQALRSEEHTSELQSRANLVCRL